MRMGVSCFVVSYHVVSNSCLQVLLVNQLSAEELLLMRLQRL